MTSVVMILYHTDKPLLKNFFTLKKKGKTLYEWISIMIPHENIKLDPSLINFYKKQLNFLLDEYNSNRI